MTSFSQHHEDEFIANFIKKNNLKITPFLVEIGAAYPEHISNSRYFIGEGWNALLIDANESFYQLLKHYHSTNDKVTVVQTLISDTDGHAKYNNLEDATLAGISETGIEMETKKLSTVLREKNLGTDIGILSIDVEGYDNQVLKSILDDKIKAQIIIIEANTKEERQKHIDTLSPEYTLVEELGRGTHDGGWAIHTNKLTQKVLGWNPFIGVNTIWIHKDVYQKS